MTPEVLPASSAGRMKNGSVDYDYGVKAGSDYIEMHFRLNINSLTISQDQYRELREIYNRIVRKHSEPVIIKTL